MINALAHRGPDDHGVEILGEVGLGCRRLAILDPSMRGHQPMGARDGQQWLVFNGQIYNYKALRAQLEGCGHTFRSGTDTEVILVAYQQFGPACINRLWGMFAIALWDAERRTLLLARDRLGEKPLYYACEHGRFAFASELKALLRMPFVGRDPDFEAINEYLAHGYVGAPRSILAGVRKVRPGNTLIVDSNGYRELPYWELEIPSRASEWAPREAADRLRALVVDSVRLRMVSDVPLGLHLSGGIDSTLIAAVMSEQSAGPIKTFSTRFEDSRFDETPFIRQVVQRFGTDHHEVVQPTDITAQVEGTLAHFDEPFGDSSAIPTALLAEFTAPHVRVALTGDGGDEVFGGYAIYGEMLDAFPRGCLPLRGLATAIANRVSPAHRGTRRLRHFGMENIDDLFVLRTSIFDAATRGLLVAGDARMSSGTVDRWKQALFPPVRDASPLRRMQYNDLRHYLPDDILVKADRMSMRYSLELRSPLLDHRIVDFTFSLPDALLVHGRDRKRLLKMLLEPYMPPDFLARPKQGFAVPLRRWLRGSGAALFERYVLHGGLASAGWLKMDFPRQLYRAHLSGRRDASSLLWTLLALGIWHERLAS